MLSFLAMKAELGPDPFIRQVSRKARGVPERAGFMEGRAEGAWARAGRADGAFALHRGAGSVRTIGRVWGTRDGCAATRMRLTPRNRPRYEGCDGEFASRGFTPTGK